MKDILLKIRNTVLMFLIFVVAGFVIVGFFIALSKMNSVLATIVTTTIIVIACYGMGNDIFGEKK